MSLELFMFSFKHFSR